MTAAVAENSTLPFSNDTNNAITLGDTDSNDSVEQLTVSATGGTIQLPFTFGLTIDAGTDGGSSFTATGTLDDLNAALDGIVFTPAANSFGSAGLNLSLNDLGNTGLGGPLLASRDIPISVGEVDQTPTISAPATADVTENNALAFSPAADTAITVADVDANGQPEQFVLFASAGTVTLHSTTGLTLQAGGNNSTFMIFSGTLADINAALNGADFTPDADTTGAVLSDDRRQ